LDLLSCFFQQRTGSLLHTAEQKAISSLLEEVAGMSGRELMAFSSAV
jgi:hypothetical protein